MNKFLKIVLTLVLAAVLAVSAFSAGTLVSIKVDPSIKILVNGQEFKPKDVNGKDVMTFTYQGTTYAPLRALAEAYGLEVGYNAEKRMATVDHPGLNIQPGSDEETIGMKNAVKKAKQYLNFTSFSYQGLLEQLEYEGFTKTEALYGVKHCEANWYEQAVKKAQQYLDFAAFSRDRLYSQLEFEGFTSDQIEYALTQIGY